MFRTCQFPSSLTDEKECASHKDQGRTGIARERIWKSELRSYVCVCVRVRHLQACLLQCLMHLCHGFWPYLFDWYRLSKFQTISVDSLYLSYLHHTVTVYKDCPTYCLTACDQYKVYLAALTAVSQVMFFSIICFLAESGHSTLLSQNGRQALPSNN